MTTLAERSSAAHAFRTARFTAMAVIAHPGMRESVVRRLQILGAADVAEAASIAEARARAIATGPRDLCVLDLALPDGSGLGLLADLRQAGWGRCVALSPGDDPYTVRAALAAGVKGFVVTGTVGETVRSTAGGRGRPTGGPDGLSQREIEVLQLVAAGQVEPGHRRRAQPVGAHREEPPGPHRPQARHRRPRRDGGGRAARRGHQLTSRPLASVA